MTRFHNFTSAYRVCIRELLDERPSASPRGQATREIVAVQFAIEDPTDFDLHCVERRWSPGYFAGELAWYMSGSNRLAPIAEYSKFWTRMSSDGETVRSAYGHRLFAGEETEFDKLASILEGDPDSRRAVVTLFHSKDGNDGPDVPCTVALQFLLRKGQLHLIATMRSNDVWFGMAYDIPFFCVLQCLMAARLGASVGQYVHQAGSFHLYEKDVVRARATVDGPDGLCRDWPRPAWDERMIRWFLAQENYMRSKPTDWGWKAGAHSFWDRMTDVLSHYWEAKRAAADRRDF